MTVIPRPAVILVDIEGTISSQRYVLDTLYPYTRAHIADYVTAHADDAEVKKALADTRKLAGEGVDLIQALHEWIDKDTKAPPLKLLQGLVWESGYLKGVFKGQIFDDALSALRGWKDAGIPRYIFSSGSVKCQVDFFHYSDRGDLRPLFDGHFDTDIGAKVETESYRRIAAKTGVPPSGILFFSDNPKELAAATEAGVQVVQVVKEPFHPADARFRQIRDFGEVTFGAAAA
jgi:enolase-phosphatase E1